MRIRLLAVIAALGVLAAACGGDDGAGVRVIDGGAEGSASGSASASASGVASGTGDVPASGALGGYTPASDVAAHAAVTLDVCEINALLPSDGPIEYESIRAIYEDGGNSKNSDGSFRTLRGFAASERDELVWNDFASYYGDAIWLDSFVIAALDGTGVFAGEPDAVRRQGIQKGIQNQIMVAWTLHELVAAKAKAEAGEFDPAAGAPHNWDEAWAFYHGQEPGCAPYATADKRGEDFGTGTAVNQAILAAMIEGREALLAGDAATASAAADEVVRQITITYTQATIKYATKMAEAVEAGDAASARVSQAEGWAFYRVIEPLIARVDPQVAGTVAGYLGLENESSPEAGSAVKAALESVYGGLGISAEEVGSLGG